MADVGNIVNFDSMPKNEGKCVEDTKQLEPRSGAEPFATGQPTYSQKIKDDPKLGELGIMGHCND